MEQLVRNGLQQIEQAADQAGKGQARTEPWRQRTAADMPLPCREPPHDPGGGGEDMAGEGAPLGIGLERRLPRRAEAQWEQLCGDDTMPPAMAVPQLLRQPYQGNAMRILCRSGTLPQIDVIGEGLESVTHLHRGPIRADDDSGSELGRRLVDLALRAIHTATPQRLDSDFLANRPSPGRPHLLLRASALPFQPDADGASSCVVVSSWRKLLSAEETAALHRELAAAIDWMHRQRPQD